MFRIYQNMLAVALIGFPMVLLRAQCPVVQGCTEQTITICDSSRNEPLFWKNALFLDSLHLTTDLFEKSYLPQITVVDPCHPADRRISYALLLDLNSDGVQETAVWSDSLPALAGRVMFGNAANPHFGGGQDAVFDSRGVLFDKQYRFGLEQIASGDTLRARVRWLTDENPGHYLVPRLPGGTHKIRWYIESGGVRDTCEQTLRIYDCMPPIVICVPSMTVALSSVNNFNTRWASDFLYAVSDSISQSSMRIAIRIKGDGTGFPLDPDGYPHYSINFNCHLLGDTIVELWAIDRTGNTAYCTVPVIVKDGDYACGDPYFERVCVSTETNAPVSGVKFSFPWGVTIEIPPLSECRKFAVMLGDFTVKPVKTDNHLNGVSTYDLLLISKHVLGVEPLGSPYKIIAADVNKSNSVTTFDIVEIRKLLLGLYDSFPQADSWRFVRRNFVFPNPANPFETSFPDSVAYHLGQTIDLDFIGIKTGDVNNTANPDAAAPAVTRASQELYMPDVQLKAGETCEVPFFSITPLQWEAFQVALQYDEDQLIVESVLPGLLPGMSTDNFARGPNFLRCVWANAQAATLLPGVPLFSLRLRARMDTRLPDALRLDETRLKAEAYDGAENPQLPLTLAFRPLPDQPAQSIVYAPQPNPGSGAVIFPLRLQSATTVRLQIADMHGKMLYRDVMQMEEGAQMLRVPENALPAEGLYWWTVWVGDAAESGRLLRL